MSSLRKRKKNHLYAVNIPMQWEIPEWTMHKYTELTDTEPRYQGGFIWDYIDQSIYKKTGMEENFRHMVVILGTDRPDYNFSGNGIVYGGERESSPKMQEVKFNYQNISAEVRKKNRYGLSIKICS